MNRGLHRIYLLMNFKPFNFFHVNQKGKYVRFNKSIHAENISNVMNVSRKHPARLSIPAGSIGLIYRVNGDTIFIGFDHDLKTPPRRRYSDEPTWFAATISMTVYAINTISIEI